MLLVEHLRKEFKNIVAVDDLSFRIDPGKIFGLLGPNGAGKTTTIRIILNIIKPTSGNVLINNNPLTSSIYNKMGYLPEERGLYKKSRVNDVITYLARLKNMPAKDISAKTSQWLEKLNIADDGKRKIEELSKGNQQKVQFITAVIHNPDIIVLDEPFAGFDPINQQIIKESIINFSREGKVVILSTHQMETAEKLCDEILLINNGKEILQGNLSSIKQKYGGNFIKIGFRGNSGFLTGNRSVLHMDCYNGYAEIQLMDGVSPSDFIREISSQTEILHFSIIEPTLNKIFIDSVKAASE